MATEKKIFLTKAERLRKNQRIAIEEIFGELEKKFLTREKIKTRFLNERTSEDTDILNRLDLIDAARDADLMISEATYGDNNQTQKATDNGHMTFAQAAEVAKRAGVKQLWLAHYSQMINDPQEYLPNATAIFENTVCGQDGMSKTLRFEN